MKTKLMDTSITPVVTPVSAQGEDQLPYGNDPEEYQGAVRLRLEATDSVLAVISFVNTLRQKLHVRIQELYLKGMNMSIAATAVRPASLKLCFIDYLRD